MIISVGTASTETVSPSITDTDKQNRPTMGDGGNLSLGLYFAFWYLGNSFYSALVQIELLTFSHP